jgi:hypothetical protein
MSSLNIFSPFPPEASPHVRIIMRKLSRRRRWRDHAADLARALAKKFPTQQSLDELSAVAGQFTTEVECLLYSIKHRDNPAKAALLRSMLGCRDELGFSVRTVVRAIDCYSMHGSDSVNHVAELVYERGDIHVADSASEDEEEEKIVSQSRALDDSPCLAPVDPFQRIQMRSQASSGTAALPHSGEFRRVTARPPARYSPAGVMHSDQIRYYCNEQDGADGLACLHLAANGAVIHSDHWSCCGMRDQSNPVCGQATEDLFSIDPIECPSSVAPASAVADRPDAPSASDLNDAVLRILVDRLRRRRRFRSQSQTLAAAIQAASSPPLSVDSAISMQKSTLYELAEINLWVLANPQHRDRRSWLPQLVSTLSEYGVPSALHLACRAARGQPDIQLAIQWATEHLDDGDLYHDSESEDCPELSLGSRVAAAANEDAEELKFDRDVVESLLPSYCPSNVLRVSVLEPSTSNQSSSSLQKHSDISSVLRFGCEADLTLAHALQSSHNASCFHSGLIVSKLLSSSSPHQLSAFVASEKGKLMCDFMIKRVAVECKNASNGFSEILGTLSALFNLEDFRATFIARVLGFLTSSDSRMCAHALAYLNKCTQLRDGISFAILSDARVIASTCNLLRFKISDTDVVESVLRTLSFVLGSIDTVDASVWGALFECFGASQHGSFSDKLGILLPANSTLKSIAADIIVSTLCIPGGYQLIKAPFFDAVFGCTSIQYEYSPLFCTLWLLKLHLRVSRLVGHSDVPVITGRCCGQILKAMSASAQRSVESCSSEQEYQSPLPFSCGAQLTSLSGTSSLHPNHFHLSGDVQGSIIPLVLPSWDSLLAALRFFKLSQAIPADSFVCVKADAAASAAVIKKTLFGAVSALIDSLEHRTYDRFIAALGSDRNSKVSIEMSHCLGRSRDVSSSEPFSPEEVSLLQTVFKICVDVAADTVKSLSMDDATGKLIPEAPVMDFTSMTHAFQDCFDVFPKHLRQTFSHACIISSIKQNLEIPEVTVSRYLARRSRSTVHDIDGLSVFAQLMDYFSLHGFSSFCLTTPGEKNVMPFRIKFKGEDGLDALQGMGGLIRECISVVSEELNSGIVPILIHRGKHDEFEIDPLLPSPLCVSSSRGRSCLVFLGALMGVAMRSGEPLALDIHSSVWFSLVGGTVSHPVDISTVDTLISNMGIASAYKNACGGYYDAAEESFFELETLSGDGTLVPVDSTMTCEEYQRALLRFANQEIAASVECIRQGLLKVVPAASVFSLTWQQLQNNVCGSSSFTVDDLEPFLAKSQTDAVSDTAFTILKVVLRSFSPQELSLFLRFCTGLSRLPSDSKSRMAFKISIRTVFTAAARSGRAAAVNQDGYVVAAAHALPL